MSHRLLVLVYLLLVFALPPRAEALTYYFTSANGDFGAWSGSVPPGYGSVDISQGANDWLYFEVTANSGYFSAADPGLTWDKFYFNFDDTSFDASKIVVDETGTWSLVTGKNVSEFGRFEYGLEGTALGASATDPLRFRIEEPGLDPAWFAAANADGWLFAAHLKRFSDLGGEESLYLGAGPGGGTPPSTPVPEPATLLLVGAGLGALALRRRGH